MALSAADLQRRHELEGAPDPFPSLTEPVAVSASHKPSPAAAKLDLDTSSQTAFPSLASASPAPVASAKPAWGSANGPRIKPAVNKATTFSDSFTLSAIDLSTAGKDGKPATLGDVMKQITTKYKVKLEASLNQKTRQTTFYIKSDSQKELDKAKRSLLALLSPVITLVINAPASTIPSIIGPKGATLKHIRDQTSVRVDIPPKDSLAVPNGNGHVNGAASGKTTPLPADDEAEEITVPVTLTGPQPLCYEAQVMLNEIISSRTAKSTQRVRDIEPQILPFVLARKSMFEAAAQGGEIKLSLNAPAREITVTGEREAVGRVVESIKSCIESFKGTLTSVKMQLPKRQHRLLVGKAADEALKECKCSVIVTKPDDPSEDVTVWGAPNELPAGLAVVMKLANSKHIHEFPLPGPISLSRQLLTYINRIQYVKTLTTEFPGVSVFTPSPAAAEKATTLTVDIVGEKAEVDKSVGKVSELLGKLIGATTEVNIDWLLHRVVQGKNGKKIKQFHDIHNVNVYFPTESAEQSTVLLVYDPFSPNASPSPDEKSKHLDDVTKELTKMAKDAGVVKTQSVTVEKRWHEAVLGKDGTTLNAIIGEEKALSIKVGTQAGDPSTEDIIVVRGSSADVDRAIAEILKIVEDAKNDEIVNSYSTEFDVEREFVGRIVGAQGAGINKLRDQLGVKVDVSDEVDEKEKEGGKKKKAMHQRSKVKITGRKENVEEAKKRILTQLERLADETSEVLKIPAQYHSSLIGQGGKYAIRLEEKYSVKITFPRSTDEGKTREQLKTDEVLIKGGKKGVAGAKSELLEAVEYEKETNNVLKFTVPTKAVARILGKGGAQINEIKDTTDAQIDVDKAPEDSTVTHITARGTKQAVAAAKAAILAIADQVVDEVTVTVTIENKFHRNLIGPGGSTLKDIVSACGGNTDAKLLASLIRFPRQGSGDAPDEVRLKGEPKLVNKIKAELEKRVAPLRDRVVLAVEVPVSSHSALIGRGGQHLTELQNKTNTTIQFPGSRSYPQVGPAENAAEMEGVDPQSIVKVVGSRAACEKAIEQLKASIKTPAAPANNFVDTLTVPLKYHHAVSQQGALYRQLRSLHVTVEQSAQPTAPAVPSPPQDSANAARIDDDADAAAGMQWETTTNYQNAEEGDATWTLKARDQNGLDRAKSIITDAIKSATKMTHVGFLTLPDRSNFPRIVGTKGANVARLRAESGADITVSRENTTIVIVGSETAITAAKDGIIKMVSEPAPPRRR